MLAVDQDRNARRDQPDTNVGAPRLVRHVRVTAAGLDAASCLAEASGLSKSRVKQAMIKGAAWLTRGSKTRRIRRATRALAVGDELHLYYDPRVLDRTVDAPTLIADEDAYSVWCKPYGMLSQGSKWGDHCTITRWAERNLRPERPAFVVHRLDRAARGLIVVAHARRAAGALCALFRQREVDKRYRVVVRGVPQLEPDRALRIDTPIDGKPAVSVVTLLEHDEARERALLDVRIETGRKHQIRRHLADLGTPVAGDRLYGGDSRGDLELLAYALAFTWPASGERRAYRLPEESLPHLRGRGVSASG